MLMLKLQLHWVYISIAGMLGFLIALLETPKIDGLVPTF